MPPGDAGPRTTRRVPGVSTGRRRPWLGRGVRAAGGVLVAAAVLLGFLAVVAMLGSDPDSLLGGGVALGAAVAGGAIGMGVIRAGKRFGPGPDLATPAAAVMFAGALWALLIGPVAARLGLLVGGTAMIVLAARTGQPLSLVVLADAFGGAFVVSGLAVLIGDVRRRRRRGRPGSASAAVEWLGAAMVNGLAAALVVAGVLDLRAGGDGSLLVGGVVATVAVLIPTVELVGRRIGGH